MVCTGAKGSLVTSTSASGQAAARLTHGLSRELLRAALPWILIALVPPLFALLTWDTGAHFSRVQQFARHWGGPVTVIEIIVVAVALARGFSPLAMIRTWPLWARLALLSLVAIAFGTAVLVAADKADATLRTWTTLVHLLFGMSVAQLITQDDWPRRHLWLAILAGLLAYGFLAALFVAAIPDPASFNWKRFGLGVIHIRHVGFYAAVGGVAGLVVTACCSGWRAGLGVGVAALMFAIDFWSGTRGSIFGIWCGFLLSFVLFRRLRTLKAAAALVCATAAGAALSLVHSVPHAQYGAGRMAESLGGKSVEAVSTGRVGMWLGTWREVLERPLVGHGQEQIYRIVPEAVHAWHPHNAVLQILFQWGFVGFFCIAALIILLAVHCYKGLQPESSHHLAAFAVLTTLLAMALHDGTLFFAYPLMMVALCVAILAAPVQACTSTDDSR